MNGKRRWLSALACLLLLAALPALAETELDLQVYSLAHLGDRYLVYQGPGKDYFRDGSAGVGASTDVRVYGYSEDWMLVGYVYSTDNFRVGWVETPRSGMEWLEQQDVGELRFDRLARRVTDDCAMTYDPVFVNARALDLDKGTEITLLCMLPKKWAYVEAKVKGKLTRGFLYAGLVGQEPLAADAAPLTASGTSPKSVLRDMATKTPGGNYAVFSGPGEGYNQAQGAPFIGFETKVKVHGSESGWVLISFTGANGARHFGYLPQSLLPDVRNVKEMAIDRVPCTLTADTALRDAPSDSAAFTARAAQGAELIFLSWSSKQKDWALVEYISGAEKARGFVPADALQFD